MTYLTRSFCENTKTYPEKTDICTSMYGDLWILVFKCSPFWGFGTSVLPYFGTSEPIKRTI